MKEEISEIFEGEIFSDEETLKKYSHDASLCEVTPSVVLFPKHSEDIKKIVSYVSASKSKDRSLSVTVRAAGSCMSGGSLNDSIILDTTKYLSGIKGFSGYSATVLPGTFYRDFEVETLKKAMILPCYTASKNLCAIGGMIGNNAAGEKTLRYGKMENYIESLQTVFSDGNLYEVRPLDRSELSKKISQDNFEGQIYKKVWNLLEKNKEDIEKAKPDVSKNSAGYYIWNVYDDKTKIFDLTKLIVGAQGTLGIVTEAKIRLVPTKSKSRLFAIFLKDLEPLAELVNEILPLEPESLESYDDATMKLALRFLPEMLKTMKAGNFFKLLWSFIPEGLMILTGGIPKLIVLVEFSGDNDDEIESKMKELQNRVARFNLKTHMSQSEAESEKYWTIRRESFNLLRRHVKGRRTAPFVDDVIVKPEHLPKFIPRMRKILDDYKLVYTIAGHAGNGNFHIIPLMDMKDPKNKDIILKVSDDIYDLVAEFGGSITAEHNDGIIRTPYLEKMFNSKTLDIFKQVKDIFDPQNIFNPGKKVGCSVEYLKEHIVNS